MQKIYTEQQSIGLLCNEKHRGLLRLRAEQVERHACAAGASSAASGPKDPQEPALQENGACKHAEGDDRVYLLDC